MISLDLIPCMLAILGISVRLQTKAPDVLVPEMAPQIAIKTSSFNCRLGTRPSLISRTRSLCPSAATMLSILEFEKYQHRMMIVKDGQMDSENISLTRVLSAQTSWRFRRCGDPKTTFRHLWHTCTSSIHASTTFSYTWKSNTSRRTSSGSMSIVTRPRRILLISLRIQESIRHCGRLHRQKSLLTGPMTRTRGG